MLFLGRGDVEVLLDVDELMDALETVFVELSGGRASVPPRVAAFAPGGFLGAMPGYVGDTLEAKLVTVFAGNETKGIASHQALIALFDAATGTPLAVMDGTHITATRTAAASAVATRALARQDVGVLAVLGAGVQGHSHLQLIPRVRDFAEIRIASRTEAHARRLAEKSGARACGSFEEAVRGADVVCLCTDSSTPVIDAAWLSPGAHITSVGASTEGGELDGETVRAGLLVVESRVAFEPPPAGAAELDGVDPDDAAELGEILSGAREGRTSDDLITVYKSMGHAVEDAAAAQLVYDRAVERNMGVAVEL